MTKHKKVILGGIFIILFWGVIFFTSGSLWNGFHFIDDHEIIVINHELTQDNKSFFEVVSKWVKDDISSVRFRPLWIIMKVTLTRLFESRSSLWLHYNLFIAILTTFLLFITGLLIRFSLFSALLFAFLTTLGLQSAIYYRLGTPETLSTLFLSCSLIFAVLSVRKKKVINVYEVFFILTALTMTLTKENYVLLLPALVFFKLYQYRSLNETSWYQATQKCLISLISLLIIFISDIIYINYFLVNFTPGTKYSDNFGFDTSRLWSTFLSLNSNSYWQILLANFLILSIIFIFSSRKVLFLELIPSIILFILIVVPQILIYAKSGIYERYLIPGVLGYSFLIAYSYDFIQSLKINLGKILVWIITGLMIFQMTGVVWNNFQLYSLQRKALDNLLTTVEVNTQTNDKILVVTNPRSFWEFGFSLRKFLNYKIHRSHVYLSSYGSLEADFYTPIYKESEMAYINNNPQDYISIFGYQPLKTIKDKDEIKCVIVFPPLKQAFIETASNWFSKTRFQEYELDLRTSTDFPFYLLKNTMMTIYIQKKA